MKNDITVEFTNIVKKIKDYYKHPYGNIFVNSDKQNNFLKVTYYPSSLKTRGDLMTLRLLRAFRSFSIKLAVQMVLLVNSTECVKKKLKEAY